MSKEEAKRETPLHIQRLCYYTSLEYLATKQATHGNVYEHRGRAVVTNSHIYYRGEKISFDIPIASIKEMRIGTFFRYQESTQLNYLALTYAHLGEEKTVLLVPSESALTPQWKTNKIIEDWFDTITRLKTRSFGTGPMDTPMKKLKEPYDKSAIVSSEEREEKEVAPQRPPLPETFSPSTLSPASKLLFTLLIVMTVLILVMFTILHGVLGFFVGIVLMAFVLLPVYYYFYIQFQIRKYIRQNREKNILFKMWTEFEEEPFLAPFRGGR